MQAPADGVSAEAVVRELHVKSEAAAPTALAFTADGTSRGGGATERIVTPLGIGSSRVQDIFDTVVLDCSCTASSLFQDDGITSVAPVYAHRSPSKTKESVAKARCFDEPGTITRVHTTQQPGRAAVVRLYSRWGIGAPSKSAVSQPDGLFEVRCDTSSQRVQWFEQGLRQLEDALGSQSQSVAFQWSPSARRLAAIRAFARRNPHLHVATVQESSSMINSMRDCAVRAHASTLQGMSRAAHKQADSFEGLSLRAVALAICDDIDKLMVSSPGSVDRPPAVQSASVAVAREWAEHMAAGRTNEAIALVAAHANGRSNRPSLAPGTLVRATGMRSDRELEGAQLRLVRFITERDRWHAQVVHTGEHVCIAPERLRTDSQVQEE